jgi:hypothetical protein
MAAVQYTFTHKQYTEQHNETEYTEYYIHNNKNTYANKTTHYKKIKIHNNKHNKLVMYSVTVNTRQYIFNQ